MAFQIRERESDTQAEWIAEWPFPPRSHFIESRAYDILSREMERYVRGEAPGRSFLISGHRGSGKTSLVRQASEDLTRRILDAAVGRAKRAKVTDPQERALNLQRPLLVKLHGPSLLGPVRKEQTKPGEKDNAAQKDGAAGGASGKEAQAASPKKDQPEQSAEGAGATKKDDQKAVASPQDAAAKQNSGAPVDSTTFALEQITIGLYRALAAEFGNSFTNHAREQLATSSQTGGEDYLELAGQFTLDLDNAPRAAALRSYFEQLGRVQSGVLWPFEIGANLLKKKVNDQGVREMVALATAAQAFEICSGEITDKQTRKNNLTRDESVDSKIGAELKDVANKFLGLGAGVLVGIGVGSDPALGWSVGAAAGAATALLSAVTLTWTSKRSRKDERTFDYTFIRKRDRESLERDLPLVIQRVREAGLAPIFVLDELDKLKDPKKSIAELISSLKHLTTDYGFFCFLTDRDYFDFVAQRVAKEAFPVEHSFFSHRMFILHQPTQLLNYLRQITATQAEARPPSGAAPSPTAEEFSEEEAARSSFGLLVLHRSKLNLIEILRKIAEECGADGRVRSSVKKLRTDQGYQYAASVQLAVNFILKRPDMRERVEEESRFMQRAIDALYMLSRAWEDELPVVRLDRDAIVRCLLKRSRNSDASDVEAAKAEPAETATAPKQAAARTKKRTKQLEEDPAAAAERQRREAEERAKQEAAEKVRQDAERARHEKESREKAEADLLDTGMSARDLDLIERAVGQLAELLSDVARLRPWIAAQIDAALPDAEIERAQLKRIFPPGNLIECIDPDRRDYKFLVDVYGQDLKTRAALAAQAAASAAATAAAAKAGGPDQAAASESIAAQAPSSQAAAKPVEQDAAEPPGARAADAADAAPARETGPGPEPQGRSPDEPLQAASTDLPPRIRLEIQITVDFVDRLRRALADIEFGMPELSRLGILPAMDVAEFSKATNRLQDAQRRNRNYPNLSKDLPVLRNVMNFVEENGFALTMLFRLALNVSCRLSPKPRPTEVIPALGRYMDLHGMFPAGAAEDPYPWRAFTNLPFDMNEDIDLPSTSIAAWREQILRWKDELNGVPSFSAGDEIWDTAAEIVRDYLASDVAVPETIPFEFVLTAAADALPGNVLRRDLREVTAADWSKLCLAGSPARLDKSEERPLWTLAAGVYALGFDFTVVASAANYKPKPSARDRDDVSQDLIASAPRNVAPGYVLVMRDDEPSIAQTTDFLRHHLAQRIPCLVVSKKDLYPHRETIGWLAGRGAITRLIHELDNDFLTTDTPSPVDRLPQFSVASSRASSREQSARGDVEFGVRSASDLIEALGRGFAGSKPEPIANYDDADPDPGPIGRLARRILKPDKPE